MNVLAFSEYLINRPSGAYTDNGEITALDNGGFSVVTFVVGTELYVTMHSFDSEGNSTSAEIPIKQTNDAYGAYPTIATLSNGDVVTTWESGGDAIVSRVFGENGAPKTGEITSTSADVISRMDSDCISLIGGGFVTFWREGSNSGDIGYRVFSSDGSSVSDVGIANTQLDEAQVDPTGVALAGGGFALAWQSYNPDTQNYEIIGQTFTADGDPIGKQVKIGGRETDNQYSQQMVAYADGSYGVGWVNFDAANERHLYYRHFADDGDAISRTVEIGDGTQAEADYTGLVGLADGNVAAIVTVEGSGTRFSALQRFDENGNQIGTQQGFFTADGQQIEFATATALAGGGVALLGTVTDRLQTVSNVYLQLFDAQGNPAADAVKVNETDLAHAGSQEIIQLADGNLAMSWDGFDATGTPMSFTKAYRLLNTAPLANDDAGAIKEGEVASVDVLNNDSDVDHDFLRLEKARVTSGNGTVEIDADGHLDIRYTGPRLAKGDIDIVRVDYTVTDGLLESTASVLVTVQPPGRGPIRGTPKPDHLTGTEGNDRIIALGDNDRVHGQGGNDTINGNSGSDRLWGDDGNDRIRGENGNDRIYGGNGNDHLASGNNSDKVWGGTGNDKVNSWNGNDVVDGGDGDDQIIGWTGDDVFTGGEGRDTFVFDPNSSINDLVSFRLGHDTITDFETQADGHDTISISKLLGVTDFDHLLKLATEDAGSTTVVLDKYNSIFLEGVHKADLAPEQFNFF